MQAKERMIQRLELFADCSRAELAWVSKHCDEIDVRAGTTIALRGAVAREFVVIVDGVATARTHGSVAIIGPGASIGADEITADRRHAATIETADDVRLLVFESRVFRSFADSAPSVARKLSGRVRASVPAPVRSARRLAVA